MRFTVTATAAGSRARAGTLELGRATVATPAFMPVGTRGTVRTVPPAQLAALDAQILLANTHHLGRRPGADALARLGGLHRWIGWPRAILTDSGGYQAFSLPGTAIDDDGVVLRDPAGRTTRLTPERSLAIQRAIGADVMMVLDHCVAATAPRGEAEAAMHRTHRWAARALAARGGGPGALFAIVQGACDPELRRISAETLTALAFDGYAIGGLAVGETAREREDTVARVTPLLPADRPRYLMGVGTPLDLLEAVHRGVDLFDCILPTAVAQHGVAYTSLGRIDLARGVHRLSERALDPACGCPACAGPSRAYLHHLIKCAEPVGWQLVAHHNLAFYLRLMARVRAALAAGAFAPLYAAERAILDRPDPDHPPGPPPRARPRPAEARGAFAIHRAAEGFASVRHAASGELMHAANHPDDEAARLYVDQSAVLARALAAPRADDAPLVVWDVGLGAGHNAMALIRAAAAATAAGRGRAIELVSFERDLDALALALAHPGAFPHVRHRAPHVLAARGACVDGDVRWRLRLGDFLAELATAPAPALVFYDPFSPRVDAPMWTLATFRRLFAHLAPGAELITYTRSTAIRSGLLAAGFWVAHGAPTGDKPETTLAVARPRADAGAAPGPYRWLGADWLARRARSAARFPADAQPGDHAGIDQAISEHPQFAGARGGAGA